MHKLINMKSVPKLVVRFCCDESEEGEISIPNVHIKDFYNVSYDLHNLNYSNVNVALMASSLSLRVEGASYSSSRYDFSFKVP